MGLDVYVGTLTRYYARQWETVVQQAAREMGLKVEIQRPNDPDDALRDPAEIEEMVVEWRDGLSAALAEDLAAPLAWTEGTAPPYFTDKPAWDCYLALLVWAAHEEHPGLPLPDVAPEDLATDPAVMRIRESAARSRYSHLLYDCELWLPAEFDITFRAEDVTGNTVGVGSVATLEDQLRELNRRTWRADAETLKQWRREGSEFGARLETSARFGLAVLIQLAALAREHGLPMKLDY